MPEKPEKAMRPLIRLLNDLPTEAYGAIVAVGNFDGVHLGHRALASEVIRTARRMGVASLIFTFDPPPLKLLRPGPWPKPLTTMERRAELLMDLGIDFVVAYSTDMELLQLDAVAFFNKIIRDALHAAGMVEGPNFRFGKERIGDVQLLRQLCSEHGLSLSIVEPQTVGKDWISSSSIREAIEAGEIDRANTSLVEPYRIVGSVETGVGRGRTLGFPTANLGSIPVLLPAHGVYAGRVVRARMPSNRAVPPELNRSLAAVHVGPNPTFGEDATKVEIHILDFSGDLYYATLEIEIVARIRAVKKFTNKEELLRQIQSDLQCVTQVLSE
jgi:riboflavin kinase/FMN adenylyltransferase